MKKILVDSISYTFTLCSAGIPIGFLGFPSDSMVSHWIFRIQEIPIGFLGFPSDSWDFQGFGIPGIRRFPLGFLALFIIDLAMHRY